MGKGRRMGLSHHDRLLGNYGYGRSQATDTDLSDLVEEDVWSMVDSNGQHDDTTHGSRRSPPGSESHGSPTFRPGRWVAGEDRRVGGLSLAFEDPSRASSRIIHQFRSQENPGPSSLHVAASAPVNVPNWPEILRVDSNDSLPDDCESLDDDELNRVPPHEYLAREYGHSRETAATSVLEGVGRTLKGRDISRVRDAVWSQTGFLG